MPCLCFRCVVYLFVYVSPVINRLSSLYMLAFVWLFGQFEVVCILEQTILSNGKTKIYFKYCEDIREMCHIRVYEIERHREWIENEENFIHLLNITRDLRRYLSINNDERIGDISRLKWIMVFVIEKPFECISMWEKCDIFRTMVAE